MNAQSRDIRDTLLTHHHQREIGKRIPDAQAEDELPEQLLGSCRFSHLDMDSGEPRIDPEPGYIAHDTASLPLLNLIGDYAREATHTDAVIPKFCVQMQACTWTMRGTFTPIIPMCVVIDAPLLLLLALFVRRCVCFNETRNLEGLHQELRVRTEIRSCWYRCV